MLKKNEAINIINAAIQNAINSNAEYKCTIKHTEGRITFEDEFGKMSLQYVIEKKEEEED